MPDRSREVTVTFSHPFMLASFDAAQPAGTYSVVIEEEEILGVSFPAYRRTSMTIQIPADRTSSASQTYPVSSEELEAALEADVNLPRGTEQS
jgi:hypothetical protein